MSDLNIKELLYNKKKDLNDSILKLQFTGKSVNYVLINTLRRIMLDHIPSYAFPSELINIEANTSIFNNDYMKLRLSQLPLFNFNHDIFYLDPLYLNDDKKFDDISFVKYEKSRQIDIYINSYNNTSDIINVTTNDIKILVDGEQIESSKFYLKNFPILLIQLRPNETFKAHMKSALSNGMKNKIFSSVSNVYYSYDNNNTEDIILNIESQGNLDEYTLLKYSIQNILHKLDLFDKDIDKYSINNSPKKNETILFEIANEDNTLGELLNYYFQEHNKIIFSGVYKPSLLERKINIKIISSDDNLITHMKDTIKIIKNIFSQILKKIKT